MEYVVAVLLARLRSIIIECLLSAQEPADEDGVDCAANVAAAGVLENKQWGGWLLRWWFHFTWVSWRIL